MKRDITGKKFGMLTAIQPTKDRQCGSVIWEFECECGWRVNKSLRNIMYLDHNSRPITCGCIYSTMKKYNYMIGKTYGKLLVKSIEYDSNLKQSMCICKCECGKEKRVSPYSIDHGLRSCSHACRPTRPTLPYGLANARAIYNIKKKGSLKHNIPFKLTFDQFLKLSTDVCVVCGSNPHIEWASAVHKGNNGAFKHNKVACIDLSTGYISGNIVTVCLEHSFEIRNLHARGIMPILDGVYI